MFSRGMRRRAFLCVLLLGACGKEEPPPPPPTLIDILVMDASTQMPIAGAEILPIDISGGLGRWQQTDDAGRLAGEREPGRYRFRVQAAGYLNHPQPGDALPELEIVMSQTATASVALIPDPGAAAEQGSIIGQVTGASGSVLVVATSVQRAHATYTDADGRFALLGLAAGTHNLTAHAAGLTAEPLMGVQAVAGQSVDEQMLQMTDAPGVMLSGALSDGDGQTELFLAEPESGAAVPGLSTMASFSGSYNLAQVPDGDYLIRAGLELDGRVLNVQRALDEGPPIAQVQGADLMVALESQPSVEGLAASAGATPTLSWSAQTDADFYVVELFDAAGQNLWGGFDASRNPKFRVLVPETSVLYDGPALSSGAHYRFRVYAAVRDPIVPSNFELIAASEERAGRFVVAR